MSLTEKAIKLAKEAHHFQVRKYTGESYFSHLENVAIIVGDHFFTGTKDFSREEIISAAYLHDTIEDTKVTAEDIEEKFGSKVRQLVVELTDITTSSDGNRKKRKQIECERLARVSYEAKSIKLADLIDNTKDIEENDEKFAMVYLHEKRELLNRALFDGHSDLYKKAKLQVDFLCRKLGI